MTHQIRTGICVAALLGAAGLCQGAVILEAGGWRAEVDDTLVNDVSLELLSVDSRAIRVQKTANFTRVNGLTGLPEAIVITWTQIADDANTRGLIFIEDEIVTNNTGVDWGAFEFALLDSGDATWGAPSTSFDVTPFTNLALSDADTVLTASGGTVANGATWTPGVGTSTLRIDVDLSRPDPMVFSLKELPFIPAPGAATAALLGGLALLRRRR